MKSFRLFVRLLISTFLLASAHSAQAAQIKLSNGTVFTGDIISQNDNFVVLQVGPSKLSIAKKMIVEATDLPAGTTLTGLPQKTQPVEPPPKPPDEWGVVRGVIVEITLTTKAKYKGKAVAYDERIITLVTDNNSQINIYRHMIADVRILSPAAPQRPAALAMPAQPAVPIPPPAQPTVQAKIPEPAPAPAPVAAAAPLTPAAPLPAPVPAQPVVPAVQPPVKLPEPAPVAVQKPVVQAPEIQPAPVPVAKMQEPTPVPAPAPVAPVPVVKIPEPVPVAPPKPVVQPPAAPIKPAVQAVPQKKELILKNGAVLTGTITSESDRVLTFQTSDGMTVNILRMLITTIDGAACVDTFLQAQRPLAGAAAPEKVEAVAGFVKALSDTSGEVRTKAVVALGAMKDTIAVLPLIGALRHSDPAIRKAAAEALGDIRDPRDILPLCAALQEPVDSVKFAVRFSLKLHTEYPFLIGTLDNNNSMVRDNAAYILSHMTGKAFGTDKQAWVNWYSGLGSGADTK